MALKIRGETEEEIIAAARVLREHALHVPTSAPVLDTCGTGGDAAGTFNISTATALTTAACGVPVAKHGNRALTSQCGSADLLEAAGVKIDLAPEAVSTCIDQVGVGFMFAPLHHAAMKHVGGVRAELGVRTIFNVLGPLINPARAKRQLLGVFSQRWLKPIARVLKSLGTKKAFVVHGSDGLDEITTTGPTYIAELSEDEPSKDHVRSFMVTPQEAGLPQASPQELKGGDAKHNLRLLKDILEGKPSALRDVILFNTAAALMVAEKVENFRDGVEQAARALDSGEAKKFSKNWSKFPMRPILKQIGDAKKEEILRLKIHKKVLEERAQTASHVRPFRKTLYEARVGLIGEIKKASPSRGRIRKDFDPPKLARALQAGGAVCLSVLTDKSFFEGCAADLTSARQACTLPVLRKDFLYDPCQVTESRVVGADCILIIMAAVSQNQAKELKDAANHWEMDALLEVHNRSELERALEIDDGFIGINNRNLNTFEVNLEVSLELAKHIPAHCLVVAESGIKTSNQVARLKAAGIRCFLVGESFMREEDVEKATRAFLES